MAEKKGSQMRDCKRAGFYGKYIKRMMDLICAALFIVIFWWLYIGIALLVYLKLGSPVIFRQQRPGKDEKIFWLYKFRTMTDDKDSDGKLLPDEYRLTKFGKWLRSTSLDELPELFNILKGDMSIIGPRPLLVKYLPYYTERERRRHEVLPGLTGLAQVNGRNAVPWEYKFNKDIEYVDHISFQMDLAIAVKTVYKVLCREGINMDQEKPVKRLSIIMDERAKQLEANNKNMQ